MNSINDQKPATKNQITNTKPKINISANVLQGYFGNSINGGMLKPIYYKQVMAGEKHVEFRLKACIKMLTPKTPAYQALKATFKAYFVPNSRVWANAEKFTAQKGGSTVTKIKEVPNIGGLELNWISNESDNAFKIPITDTDIWRDSWVSTYIPRFQTGRVTETTLTFPKYSALPLRGFMAIYNDYERNKEYDSAWAEFNGDTVTSSEWNMYMNSYTVSSKVAQKLIVRGKRQNSYYTDYRTEMLGEDITEPVSGTGDLITITEWEKKVAEMRSQAENAQLNDWDIIAKIRGSKRIKTGKVQLLGTKTINLNYSAVTQSTYNINENVEEEFQAMGTQGAYSYTEIDIPMYRMEEFEEEGYIHITMQVSADSVFETGFERTGLNVNVMDQYRPDLKQLKHDVLYEIEKCGTNTTTYTNINGFKRKYSELFKLPNVISGDLFSTGAYRCKLQKGQTVKTLTAKTKEIPQKSFQFFEIDDKQTQDGYLKNIWQDYTDILINENQAVKQTVQYVEPTTSGTIYPSFIRILGQNQVFFVGMATCVADLPVDGEIKNNFTTWGEK